MTYEQCQVFIITRTSVENTECTLLIKIYEIQFLKISTIRNSLQHF